MKKLALSSLFLVSLVYAQECSYELMQPKVGFKAFKTYEKLGVKGGFDAVEFASKKQATLESSLVGSIATVNVKSLNTGNKGRDETLMKSFFDIQNVSAIKAVVKEVKNNKLFIDITMNKTTKTIPMPFIITNDTISAKGVIDLADFGMVPSLEAINKACFALHDGKTWQDVEIEFELKFTKVCN